ncbi:diguanylate cyclase domain-containing protein [Anaerolentibacter hominis]|uniref:diguanylate cyclase domain-containing protein n=1 Tax=Anaerolentibacter hominis TaxID=3079009 RepID=UPI003CCEE717
MSALLELLGENISWIGSGAEEVCFNLEEARRTLEWEKIEYPMGFKIEEEQYQAVSLTDRICVVYGYVRAASQAADLADINDRVTAVCEISREGMKLLHLHLSSADDNQAQGESYVKKSSLEEKLNLENRMEQTKRQLSRRTQELEMLFENIPGGVHQCKNDPCFTLINMSRGCCSLFGYTREEVRAIFQDQFIQMIYPGDRAEVLRCCRERLRQDSTLELEYRVVHKSGRHIWVLDKAKLVTDPDGNQSIFCMLVEITERKKTEENLRLSLERHQVIMDQANDIIFEWDINQDTLDFSANWKKKFGYEAISCEISSRIPRSLNIHPNDMAAFIKIMKDTAAGVPYSETEFRIRSRDGSYAWCRIRATTQYDSEARPIKAVGVIVDIDQDKKQKDKLIEQAQKDALTGLLNKSAVREQVERYLCGTGRRGAHALFLIDLDNFKTVNDRYGHLAGDAVLSELGVSLKKLFRATDLIGRIGGDEFLVFLPGVSDSRIVEKRAAEILQEVDGISAKEQLKMQLSCSIGIAFCPDDAKDYENLCRCADKALYYVKNLDKGNYAFYDLLRPGSHSPEETTINETIDSDIGNIDETLARYTFRMLHTAADIPSAVCQLLGIIGRAYGADRVYIYEADREKNCYVKSFEWCEDGIHHGADMSAAASGLTVEAHRKLFDSDGILCIRNIQTEEPSPVLSILQCALTDRGEHKGFLGFDDCRRSRLWTREQLRSVSLITDVIGTFLCKYRAEETIGNR